MGLLNDWLMDQADPNGQYRSNYKGNSVASAALAALYNNGFGGEKRYRDDERSYGLDGMAGDGAQGMMPSAADKTTGGMSGGMAPDQAYAEMFGRRKQKGLLDVLGSIFGDR